MISNEQEIITYIYIYIYSSSLDTIEIPFYCQSILKNNGKFCKQTQKNSCKVQVSQRVGARAMRSNSATAAQWQRQGGRVRRQGRDAGEVRLHCDSSKFCFLLRIICGRFLRFAFSFFFFCFYLCLFFGIFCCLLLFFTQMKLSEWKHCGHGQREGAKLKLGRRFLR